MNVKTEEKNMEKQQSTNEFTEELGDFLNKMLQFIFMEEKVSFYLTREPNVIL